MPIYHRLGRIPRKRHSVFRKPDGGLHPEQLVGNKGVTGPASLLYHLDTGGHLIDAPGVRDYAPPPVGRRDVAAGFREIAALAPGCRFADCMHMAEPRCAVRAAVEDGGVSPRRYESYRRLVRLMERLEASG